MDWEKILPSLIGGGISAVTAVIMFSLAQWIDSRKRAAERKRSAAHDAYGGLLKLVRSGDSIENLARHIDKQIKDAHELNRDFSDIAAIIQPILGASILVEDLTAQETRFLTKSDGEFLSRIWEIQQRARNNDVIAAEYSKFRLAYDAFIETKAPSITAIEGATLSVSLEGDDAKIATIKLGRLNQIIVPLIASLDEDRKTIVTVIDEYIAFARSAFGDDFPAKKFEARARKC